MKQKQKSGLIFLLFIAGALFSLHWLRQENLQLNRLAVIGLIFAAALLLHGFKAYKNPDYLPGLLAPPDSPKRVHQYDYLRLAAVSTVILTHAIQTDLSNNLVEGDFKIYFATAVYVFCLVCNPIYAMLSGALLLPYREEKLSSFYIHRIPKIVLPMIVYYIFYCWYLDELEVLSSEVIGEAAENFIKGNTPECPHYWLLYIILSLYIVYPFLRYMLRDLPYRKLTALVMLFFIFEGIRLFLPAFAEIHFAVSLYFNSWVGVAIMGYWVSRPETKRYYRWLLAAGAVSTAALFALVRVREDFLILCCNTSPIMCGIALALFAGVFSCRLFQRGNILLRLLSKYSFSIILIHWYVLHQVTIGSLHIRISWFHGTGLLLSLVVTLTVSLALSLIFDQLILAVLETVVKYLNPLALYRTVRRYRVHR